MIRTRKQPARGLAMARILVIDDDSDVRTLMVYELRVAGHEVRGASDGAEGLTRQRESPADVVVTDIYMPEKEGIETIRDLKEEFPRVKIIAISGGGRNPSAGGFSAHDLRVVAGELGVIAVLQKPFETRELLRSIESALGEH
jgi:CheY-like chemotaxis protein